MAVTLRLGARIRFSEIIETNPPNPSARSQNGCRRGLRGLVSIIARRARPGHDDARRHVAGGAGARAPGGAVMARRHPEDALERAAERAQAREADLEADLGDRALGLPQQRHRALEPPALQVA